MLPGAQSKHCEAPLPPWYLPIAQSVHSSAPDAEYLPTSQEVQLAAPLGE